MFAAIPQFTSDETKRDEYNALYCLICTHRCKLMQLSTASDSQEVNLKRNKIRDVLSDAWEGIFALTGGKSRSVLSKN
jgi:hypothetical protein